MHVMKQRLGCSGSADPQLPVMVTLSNHTFTEWIRRAEHLGQQQDVAGRFGVDFRTAEPCLSEQRALHLLRIVKESEPRMFNVNGELFDYIREGNNTAALGTHEQHHSHSHIDVVDKPESKPLDGQSDFRGRAPQRCRTSVSRKRKRNTRASPSPSFQLKAVSQSFSSTGQISPMLAGGIPQSSFAVRPVTVWEPPGQLNVKVEESEWYFEPEVQETPFKSNWEETWNPPTPSTRRDSYRHSVVTMA